MTKPYSNIGEIWEPMVGWEGLYEISNQGRVCRILARPGCGAPRVLKGRLSKQGYPAVQLSNDKRKQRCVIHRLVAAAFLGPRPAGLVINHINGIKTDNRVENLEYVTPRANTHHAMRMGLMRYDISGITRWRRDNPEKMPRGERIPGAKLTPEKVVAIRELRASGIPRRRVARMYNVSPGAIWSIEIGRSWAHV